MILSENRVPLFGIMLWGEGRDGQETAASNDGGPSNK